MNYLAYLSSPKWRRIRSKVLRRDNWRCRSCGAKAAQVHHVTYDKATMDGQDLSRLLSVCHACHEATTFTVDGRRRTVMDRLEMAFMALHGESKEGRKCRQPKMRRSKLTINQIRARSLEYAQGLIK